MKLKIAIAGASRGLGYELSQMCYAKGYDLHLAARTVLNWNPNGKGYSKVETNINKGTARVVDLLKCDFTKTEDLLNYQKCLLQFSPTHFVYCAGGGPFGEFGRKHWKDHLWAYRLNLLAPAQLTHYMMSELILFPELSQILFVGSGIADAKGDFHAASYSSAKHGLSGLYKSLKLDYPDFDFKYARPGYMDTGMLPLNAEPRSPESKSTLHQPTDIAMKILSLMGV